MRGAKTDIAEIYFKAYATQSGFVKSLLLAREGNAIVTAELSGRSDWSEIRSETLDCLIITLYEEGLLQRGDFVYFGTNKYRKDGNAVYSFGGVEMVAVTSGESRSAKETPRAVWLTFLTLTFVYVGAIVILGVVGLVGRGRTIKA